MTTRPFSVRLERDLIASLDARSRLTGEPKATLAHRYIAEGLRMEAHPGIVFRSGPAGRRPGLAGGPDVWEVVRAVRSFGGGEEGLARAAEWLELAPDQARAAVRYYAEYRDDVDAWIAKAEAEAELAEAAWQRERDALA